MAKKQSLKARETAVVKQMAAYVKDAREARQGDVDAAEQQAKSSMEHKRWEDAEKSCRLARPEIASRVHNLRVELESYRDQLESLPFDIPCGDFIPGSLDNTSRRYTLELIEELHPYIKNLFDMIDDYADKHGCQKGFDFSSKLYSLKEQSAETGFQLGILAGVIFTGSSQEQINKFERGLVHMIGVNHWRVKE